MKANDNADVRAIIHDTRSSEKDFFQAVQDRCGAMAERMIADVLEDEVTRWTQAGWHRRCPDKRWDYRCGYHRPRHIQSFGGPVEVRVPRTRRGFRSKFVQAYLSRSEQFEQAIRSVYIGGQATRETSATIWSIFGESVSPSTVSRIMQTIDCDTKRFHNRSLLDEFDYLIFDGMWVRCMIAPPPQVAGALDGQSIEKVVVLLASGVRSDGSREIIDFRVAPGEMETAWDCFLADLIKRGLTGRQVKLIVHDGSTGLHNAIATNFGNDMATQRCICHKLANVEGAADPSVRSLIRDDASRIYQASDATEARRRQQDFVKRWQCSQHKAVAALQEGFEATLSFFNVPVEHRPWITTSNVLERQIRELRRRTDPMNAFMGLDHLNRAIYLAIQKISPKRRHQVPLALWSAGKRSVRKRRSPVDLATQRNEFFDRMMQGLGTNP